MRIFKNNWFDRFATKEGIKDCELVEVVSKLETGKAVADLGGNVYKVRVARSGEGKSGGYRVILFFRSMEKTFYIYGFSKSDRANISKKELVAFKEAARKYFSMSPYEIEKLIRSGQLIEI